MTCLTVRMAPMDVEVNIRVVKIDMGLFTPTVTFEADNENGEPIKYTLCAKDSFTLTRRFTFHDDSSSKELESALRTIRKHL